MNPAGTFLRFVLGFLVFISVSFVVTFFVSTYGIEQEEAEQTAAAVQAMLEIQK